MAKPEQRNLERVRYWQGQMLKSKDFMAIEAAEAQRRWWHNRALHNAYGVAEGLSCALVPSNEPTGLAVSPGLAYDISGREMILEKTVTVPFPTSIVQNLTGTVSLLMRYKPRSGCLRPDEATEICLTSAAGGSTGDLSWKVNTNPQPSDGVSLAQIIFSGGRFKGFNPQFVNVARPLARPLLASGTTIPGNTPWELWTAGLIFDDTESPIPAAIGVQTRIDTSAAGFTRIPCYFASLQGSVWDPQLRLLLPAILPSIAEESIDGFTFRLWLQIPETFSGQIELRELTTRAALVRQFTFITASEFATFARRMQLCVSWTGCQMLETLSSCCSRPASSAAAELAVRNS